MLGAVVGDEDWEWKATGSVLVGPSRDLTLREGTPCFEREHHDLTAVLDDVCVCDDCGYVS